MLPAGTVLGAPQIGVAAAVGAAELPVAPAASCSWCRPVPSSSRRARRCGPGQIYESNGADAGRRGRTSWAASRDGALRARRRRAPDPGRSASGSTRAASTSSITSGGISAGAYEVVKEALAGRGVEFVKVAMQPGGPQGVGRLGATGVVALPGNPVSSQVSFEVFVRPALRAALGHPHPERARVTAALAAALTSTPGRRQFRRGVLDAVAGTVRGDGRSALAPARGARPGRLLLRGTRGRHRTPGGCIRRGLAAGPPNVT